MNWKLDKAPGIDEATGEPSVDIILRAAAAKARKSASIYLLGPNPFTSPAARVHFCRALAQRHRGPDDCWLLWHMGSAGADGCLHGDADAAADTQALLRFVEPAGWYGGWWPRTWTGLEGQIRTVVAPVSTYEIATDLELIFLQDRLDRVPLGWHSQGIEEFIGRRETLPTRPHTQVTLVGGTGHRFWVHKTVRAISFEELIHDMNNRAAPAGATGAASLEVEIIGPRTPTGMIAGSQLRRTESGKQFYADSKVALSDGVRLFRIRPANIADVEIDDLLVTIRQ